MSFSPFTTLKTRTFIIRDKNIDTDQIIPARFLTTTDRKGLGDLTFRDWRFDASGARTDHPLNAIDMQAHQVLVAGDNFGCGSSREHAAWSLLAFGFRTVVSTSFGDIFRSNAMKNGLLTISLPTVVHQQLLDAPGTKIEIDLKNERIRTDMVFASFETEPFARSCLLAGMDPLSVLLQCIPDIVAHEARMETT